MNNINQLKDILSFIKNPKFYIIICIAIFLVLLFIFIINNKKFVWLKKISIPTLILAIILILANYVFSDTLVNLIKTNDENIKIIITPFVKSLLNNLSYYGFILLVISIISLIMYIILKNKLLRE